jgi:hypothetical protein
MRSANATSARLAALCFRLMEIPPVCIDASLDVIGKPEPSSDGVKRSFNADHNSPPQTCEAGHLEESEDRMPGT